MCCRHECCDLADSGVPAASCSGAAGELFFSSAEQDAQEPGRNRPIVPGLVVRLKLVVVKQPATVIASVLVTCLIHSPGK